MRKIKEPANIYPIGHTYTVRRPKHTREYKVIDYLRTYNNDGNLVKFRYVCLTSFLGQNVYDYDVLHTTIKRASMEAVS